MKYLKIFTTFIFFFLIALHFNPVYAQQSDNNSFSIKITPNNNNIAINPGNSVTLNLYIQNLSKTNIVAWIYTRDFKPSDSKGDVKIFSDSNYNSGTESWITFNGIYSQDQIYDDTSGNITFKQVTPTQAISSGYISLTPNQQFTLTFTVQVPNYAYFGTHNTIIFVQPIINSSNSSTGSTVQGRIGSNLLIDVGQGPKSEVSIKSVSVKQSSIFTPPTLNINLKNNGDYVNFTKSTLALSAPFTSAKVSLDPITVLSHSERLINYKGKSNITLDSITSLYFIKYNAKIEVTDTSTGQIITKTISFIYINPIVIITLLALLIIIFIIYRRFKNR